MTHQSATLEREGSVGKQVRRWLSATLTRERSRPRRFSSHRSLPDSFSGKWPTVHGCANYILKWGAVHSPDPPGLVRVGDLYQLYGLTEEGIVVVEGR